MVALRKDVKVGFVVAGIMIAVVGVYFALAAVTGGVKAPAGAETASLRSTPSSTPKTPTVNAKPSSNSTPTPAVTPRPTPSVVASQPPATPSVARQSVAPTPAPTASSNDDVWATAFSNGAIPPARTVTPDRVADANRDVTAKPSEIIQTLNAPANGTGDASSAAGTADDAKTRVADASSGSIATGSTLSTLTTRSPNVDATPGAAKTHVVAAGETLSAIAAVEYGSPTLYDVILKANPGVDPGRMRVGTKLTIPPHDASKVPASTPATPASVDSKTQYVVKPGDSLERIATTLYGDRAAWQAIYDANRKLIGDSPANIKVGETLALPKPPTR